MNTLRLDALTSSALAGSSSQICTQIISLEILAASSAQSNPFWGNTAAWSIAFSTFCG